MHLPPGRVDAHRVLVAVLAPIREGLHLVFVALPVDLGEFTVRVGLLAVADDGREPARDADRRQLLQVSDRDHPFTPGCALGRQLGQVAGISHPRLVDDQHVTDIGPRRVALDLVPVADPDQRRNRLRANTRLGGQDLLGHGRGRGAGDGYPGLLERQRHGPHDGGLAGAGPALQGDDRPLGGARPLCRGPLLR